MDGLETPPPEFLHFAFISQKCNLKFINFLIKYAKKSPRGPGEFLLVCGSGFNVFLVVVWACPGGVSLATLRGVISKHHPDPVVRPRRNCDQR